MVSRVVPFVLVALFVVALEGTARSCAVCASGDASMRPREAARPASGAFGAAVDVRAGSLTVLDTVELSEWRTEGSVHIAPKEGLRLRLAVPVLARRIVGISSTDATRPVLGDVVPSVDAVVSEANEGTTTRTVALTVGLALPTAPVAKDAEGKSLPSMLQPGCSSVIPEAQVSYRFRSGAFSLVGGPRARLPMPVRDAPHRGAMVSLAVGGQFQPHPRFAARITGVARVELEGADARGSGDGISGGFVGYVAPEIAVRPTMDLALTWGLSVPVAQALGGSQRESVVFVCGLSWDI